MRPGTLALAVLLSLGHATGVAAFQVQHSDKGLPLRWAPGEVSYHVDPQGGLPVPKASFAGAVDGAFAAWTVREGTRLELVPGPDAPGGFGYEPGADNVSVIRYAGDEWEHDPDALMLTFTNYRISDGAIVDSDILINGVDHRWRADGRTDEDEDETFDLQNALTHEVGHFLGLAHSPDHVEAVMFPSVTHEEVSKRTLSSDDTEGLDYLYVAAALPRDDANAAAGCGVGGSSPTTLGVLALLLAALGAAGRGRRRGARRRCAAPLWVALVVLTAGSAGATTLRYRSIGELARAADVVVHGRVVEVRALRVGRLIMTDTTVRVDRCLRGVCGGTVIVRQPGGELGGVGLHVAGTFEARPGAELVLLLRRGRAGRLAPLGMMQGALRVERPRAGPPVAVRDLAGVLLAPRQGPRPRQVFTLEMLFALVDAARERSPR